MTNQHKKTSRINRVPQEDPKIKGEPRYNKSGMAYKLRKPLEERLLFVFDDCKPEWLT